MLDAAAPVAAVDAGVSVDEVDGVDVAVVFWDTGGLPPKASDWRLNSAWGNEKNKVCKLFLYLFIYFIYLFFEGLYFQENFI